MKKFIRNAVCDGNRVTPITRNPLIWKNHWAPPEIAVYIEAGISDIMMGAPIFFADDPKPRVRQFPEPHRYDHREAMSKLID